MRQTNKIILLCLICSSIFQSLLSPVLAEDFDRKRNRLIGYILGKQLPVLHFSDKELNDELAVAVFDLYIKQLDYQKRFLLAADVTHLEAFIPFIDSNLVTGKIVLPDTGFDILNEKIDIVEKMVDEMLAGDAVYDGEGKPFTFPRFSARPRQSCEVMPGDTLAGIARKYDGVTVDDLLLENDIADPSRLKIGQTLVIPRPNLTPGGMRVGVFAVTRKESYESDPEKLKFVADLAALKDRWRKILKTQLISEYLDLVEEREEAVEKDDGREGFKNDGELWKEAFSKVRKRNKTFFHRLRQETLQDHYDRFFNCVARAFGPHTNYIPPATKEQFDINMKGSLEGIGALLREDDGFIKVVRIIPGSASARQGQLKAEDIILAVAQEGEEPVDITDMRLRDAVRLIRGPKGETVTLTIKRTDGTKDTIRIIRDVVQIEETFVKSTVLENDGGPRVGYIHIPSFYRDFEGSRNGAKARNCTDDTRLAIEKLKEQFVRGIILDLRDDGGGALVDAVDIAGLFIESGPIVQVKNSFGEQRILSDLNGSVYWDGPLVVLVNKFSASASEIVAAALQDYGRAVIMGSTHTHGKGTVQTILDMNENIPLLHMRKYDDLGAFKVMIQKFYRINGGSTQYKGVEPDIVLPDLYEHVKSGERYLDYSLPWDSIAPVDYIPWRSAEISKKKIIQRSLERIKKSKGLQIIAEEQIKAAEKSKNSTVVIELSEMRNKRVEAERMREKVGEHYTRFKNLNDGSDDGDASAVDYEKEARTKWLKEVNDDPYIDEAVNVIGDLIFFGKG